MASAVVPPACPLQDAGSQDVASEDLEVVGPAKGKAQSRATLDELLATLRLLEEEPEPLPNPRAYHKDKYSWTDEVTAGCPGVGNGCRLSASAPLGGALQASGQAERPFLPDQVRPPSPAVPALAPPLPPTRGSLRSSRRASPASSAAPQPLMPCPLPCRRTMPAP